jgi:hypothetical protein
MGVVSVWDVSQYWSILKIAPEPDDTFDDGRPVEFIPEKSNKFDELGMLLSQAYNSKGDVDFRNCVNGESGLGGATPFCGMVG